MTKKQCAHCSMMVPIDFWYPLITTRGAMPLCPECALAERNRIHGLPKGTPFRGAEANHILNRFRKWKARRSRKWRPRKRRAR